VLHKLPHRRLGDQVLSRRQLCLCQACKEQQLPHI